VMAVIAIFIHGAQSVRMQQKAVMVAQQQRAMGNEAAARKAAQDAAAERAKEAAEQVRVAQAAAAKEAKAAQDAAIARANAIQEKAERHAQFLAQYLNASLPQKTGNKTVAIAVVSEKGTLNRAVAAAIADRFKKEPVQIISSLFKPAFVADGMFQEILNGSGGPFDRLDLVNSLDGAVLARQNVQYAQNPSLEKLPVSDTSNCYCCSLPYRLSLLLFLKRAGRVIFSDPIRSLLRNRLRRSRFRLNRRP